MKNAAAAIVKHYEGLLAFHAAMDPLDLDANQRLHVLHVKAKYDKRMGELAEQLSEMMWPLIHVKGGCPRKLWKKSGEQLIASFPWMKPSL